MSIKDIELNLIEDFELFDDWMDKYNFIIGMGKELDGIEEDEKIQDNLVSGCTSQVWLVPQLIDDRLYFKADSDALIPKGIAAMLVKLYSGNPPQEILDHKPEFIKKIGLEQHLSPNRANGLASMINKMKSYAEYYSKIK